MLHTTLIRAAVTAMLLATLSSPSAAQFVPPGGSAGPSDKDCKKAARIVEKGKPDKKEEWAFTIIVSCPADVGAAGAAAIRQMRTVTDTAVLAAIWSEFTLVIDAGLMSAYLEVLADASSSIPARVFAVAMLLTQESGGGLDVDYGELVNRGADCRIMAIGGAYATVTSRLPAGHGQTVRNALTAVANSPTAPRQVRNAAACAFTYIGVGNPIAPVAATAAQRSGRAGSFCGEWLSGTVLRWFGAVQ